MDGSRCSYPSPIPRRLELPVEDLYVVAQGSKRLVRALVAGAAPNPELHRGSSSPGAAASSACPAWRARAVHSGRSETTRASGSDVAGFRQAPRRGPRQRLQSDLGDGSAGNARAWVFLALLICGQLLLGAASGSSARSLIRTNYSTSRPRRVRSPSTTAAAPTSAEPMWASGCSRAVARGPAACLLAAESSRTTEPTIRASHSAELTVSARCRSFSEDRSISSSSNEIGASFAAPAAHAATVSRARRRRRHKPASPGPHGPCGRSTARAHRRRRVSRHGTRAG